MPLVLTGPITDAVFRAYAEKLLAPTLELESENAISDARISS